MRKGLLVFIITIFLCALFASCGLEPVDENRSINHYIFPYVKFTLSDDGTYYSASILKGARVANVYIPGYVNYNDVSSLPVKFFNGFENSEDIVNLEGTTFESSITEIKLKSLDQASILETIHYENVESSTQTWQNLPDFPHTNKREFVGWFTTDTNEEVHNGDAMDPEHSKVYAKYVDIELLEHKQAEATCTGDGYTQDCYECSYCRRFFSDDQAQNEISDVVIKALGHNSDETYHHDGTSHWYECTRCQAELDKEAHSFTAWSYNIGDNLWHRHCTICRREEEDEHITHTLDHYPRKEATCLKDGNIEYWQCDVCLKYYSDVSATEEITQAKTVIAHHNLSEWKYDDDNHWKICDVDGVVFKDSHTWGPWQEHPSWSVEHLYSECEVCGARKVATKPEYKVYDIGIGEAKLKDLEDIPCGDFYVNGIPVKSKEKITVDDSAVTVEFGTYLGSNTNYQAFCYVYNNGQKTVEGIKDSCGNYSVKISLTNKLEHTVNIQIITEGGSLSFDCYIKLK